MKKIITITFCFCLALVTFNCNEEGLNDGKFNSNPESGWIEFDNESSSTNQGQAFVEIPISLPIGINPNGQSITYSISLLSGSLPDGALGTFSTVIPPAETTANIVFDIPQSDDSYEVVFTLLRSDNAGFQIGLPDGSKQITHNLFVNCAPVVGTTYNGTVTSSDIGLTSSNNGPFNFTATITQTSDNTYAVNTAWGPNFVALLAQQPGLAGAFVYPATLTLNADGSVTVTGGAAYATGGSGSYDPCEDVFTYNISQAVFNGDFTVDVVLSPL